MPGLQAVHVGAGRIEGEAPHLEGAGLQTHPRSHEAAAETRRHGRVEAWTDAESQVRMEAADHVVMPRRLRLAWHFLHVLCVRVRVSPLCFSRSRAAYCLGQSVCRWGRGIVCVMRVSWLLANFDLTYNSNSARMPLSSSKQHPGNGPRASSFELGHAYTYQIRCF